MVQKCKIVMGKAGKPRRIRQGYLTEVNLQSWDYRNGISITVGIM